MDKKKDQIKGRPVLEDKTVQKNVRIPTTVLGRAIAKAKSLGLNFQQYVLFLITKDLK